MPKPKPAAPFGTMSPWEGATGEMTNYHPSWRDKLADALATTANAISGKNYNEARRDSMTLMGLSPGIGTAMSAQDAAGDFKKGNYVGAAANAVGAIPDGGPAVKAIFAGLAAKTADRAMLSAAEKMAAAGADKTPIWDATGWFRGPDNKWRFEIDDSAAKFRPRAQQAFDASNIGDEAYSHNADGMMSHPPLHAAYDDLWKVDTHLSKGGGYPYQPSARYQVRDSGKEQIYLDASNLESAKSLNVHELQHAVQGREGFAGGGDAINGSVAEHRDEIMKEALAEHAKGVPLGDAMVRAEQRKRMDLYNRSAGEVEARNVEARMNMTPEQRRATPPWLTQDIPFEQQIVRPRK